jgi:hypothetical protein
VTCVADKCSKLHIFGPGSPRELGPTEVYLGIVGLLVFGIVD